jgi:hypothetical protein
MSDLIGVGKAFSKNPTEPEDLIPPIFRVSPPSRENKVSHFRYNFFRPKIGQIRSLISVTLALWRDQHSSATARRITPGNNKKAPRASRANRPPMAQRAFFSG